MLATGGCVSPIELEHLLDPRGWMVGGTTNPNLLTTRRPIGSTNLVICPSGGFLTGLSSLLFRIFRKIFVATYPKSHLELSPSHPTRGAYHDRHGRGEGCGGRGSVLRAT